jgi:kinesin family protein 20
MIVNVNPYDTGYDENSHVMKFAALAREVYVSPAPAPVQHIPAMGDTPGKATKLQGKSNNVLSVLKPRTRKVTISMGGAGTGRRPTDAILEVIEGIVSSFLALLVLTDVL